MKVIFISQRLVQVQSTGEIRECLSPEWSKFINQLSDNVILFPLSIAQIPQLKILFQQLKPCGVVLSGGNSLSEVFELENNIIPDKDPSVLGPNWTSDLKVDQYESELKLSKMRDDFELQLLNYSYEYKVPVIGVCRGCQFLAVKSGMSLCQVNDHVATRHKLYTKHSSDIFANNREVNSYHGWAIKLSDNKNKLMSSVPLLYDADGYVEALECKERQQIGIMWHPERETVADPLDLQLFRQMFHLKAKANVKAIIVAAGRGSRLKELTNDVPKCMVKYKNIPIIDYILATMRSCLVNDITIIRGYLSHVLVRHGVKYGENKDWNKTNMMYTLMTTLPKESDSDIIVSYSDIIYTPLVMNTLLAATGDVCVIVDKDWRTQWEQRMDDPLSDAETMKINAQGYIQELGKKPKSYDDIEGQYIGLFKISSTFLSKWHACYNKLDRNAIYDGKTFPNLYMTSFLQHLINSGTNIVPVYIHGGWCEVDAPEDLEYSFDTSSIPVLQTLTHSQVPFGTKAENLYRLQLLPLKTAKILPLLYFTLNEWNADPNKIIKDIIKTFNGKTIIVRSSAKCEDSLDESFAGAFTSVNNIDSGNKDNIRQGIVTVIKSYGNIDRSNLDDQVLVQQSLHKTDAVGVMFSSALDTGLPYINITYDKSGNTESVTSGSTISDNLVRIVCVDNAPIEPRTLYSKLLLNLVQNLKSIFNHPHLDIEFAFVDNELYLLQVRPLYVSSTALNKSNNILKYHKKIRSKLLHHLPQKHPDLAGASTIFGVMTDWNPAEIIGIKPRPLALSLYQQLVTDFVAMESRREYGFRQMTKFPLLVSFLNRPYIDIRVSLNSFIPNAIPTNLAHKLVDYYLFRLRNNSDLHDKVEFQIVFTCYHLNLSNDINVLLSNGFTRKEVLLLKRALLKQTNNLFTSGKIEEEFERINQMEINHERIMKSDIHIVEKMYLLLEDIKQLGTLPFAGLARCGFIARQWLESLKTCHILSSIDVERFMQSTHTVSGELSAAINKVRNGKITKEDFLKQYGHLRPGTYDINSKRYDEDFNGYFGSGDCNNNNGKEVKTNDMQVEFHLSNEQTLRLNELLFDNGLNILADDLMKWIGNGIKGREYSKFVFSKALSDVLKLVEKFGAMFEYTRDDMSYVPISVIHKMYGNLESKSVRLVLKDAIKVGQEQHRIASMIELPDLIVDADDVYEFEAHTSKPSFVTSKTIMSEVVFMSESSNTDISLSGKIILTEKADPGWDWLFTKNIAGLVTCFGGVNSHMAIRSAELNIPAVLGAGKLLFDEWKKAKMLRIDCKSQLVCIV